MVNQISLTQVKELNLPRLTFSGFITQELYIDTSNGFKPKITNFALNFMLNSSLQQSLIFYNSS